MNKETQARNFFFLKVMFTLITCIQPQTFRQNDHNTSSIKGLKLNNNKVKGANCIFTRF